MYAIGTIHAADIEGHISAVAIGGAIHRVAEGEMEEGLILCPQSGCKGAIFWMPCLVKASACGEGRWCLEIGEKPILEMRECRLIPEARVPDFLADAEIVFTDAYSAGDICDILEAEYDPPVSIRLARKTGLALAGSERIWEAIAGCIRAEGGRELKRPGEAPGA